MVNNQIDENNRDDKSYKKQNALNMIYNNKQYMIQQQKENELQELSVYKIESEEDMKSIIFYFKYLINSLQMII